MLKNQCVSNYGTDLSLQIWYFQTNISWLSPLTPSPLLSFCAEGVRQFCFQYLQIRDNFRTQNKTPNFLLPSPSKIALASETRRDIKDARRFWQSQTRERPLLSGTPRTLQNLLRWASCWKQRTNISNAMKRFDDCLWRWVNRNLLRLESLDIYFYALNLGTTVPILKWWKVPAALEIQVLSSQSTTEIENVSRRLKMICLGRSCGCWSDLISQGVTEYDSVEARAILRKHFWATRGCPPESSLGSFIYHQHLVVELADGGYRLYRY